MNFRSAIVIKEEDALRSSVVRFLKNQRLAGIRSQERRTSFADFGTRPIP